MIPRYASFYAQAMITLMSPTDTTNLAQLGALLLVIAGAWTFLGDLPFLKLAPGRGLITGLLLAASGIAFLVALRSGNPI